MSGGGVLVMFSGLEPQLEGEEPRILREREKQRKQTVVVNIKKKKSSSHSDLKPETCSESQGVNIQI